MNEIDEMKQKIVACLELQFGYIPILEIVDNLLNLETDTCRLAIVRKHGELPNADPKYASFEYAVAQEDMLTFGYVQEAK